MSKNGSRCCLLSRSITKALISHVSLEEGEASSEPASPDKAGRGWQTRPNYVPMRSRISVFAVSDVPLLNIHKIVQIYTLVFVIPSEGSTARKKSRSCHSVDKAAEKRDAESDPVTVGVSASSVTPGGHTSQCTRLGLLHEAGTKQLRGGESDPVTVGVSASSVTPGGHTSQCTRLGLLHEAGVRAWDCHSVDKRAERRRERPSYCWRIGILSDTWRPYITVYSPGTIHEAGVRAWDCHSVDKAAERRDAESDPVTVGASASLVTPGGHRSQCTRLGLLHEAGVRAWDCHFVDKTAERRDAESDPVTVGVSASSVTPGGRTSQCTRLGLLHEAGVRA
ncbi:hypothetical protein J6590_081688 [Homalodisca vitripennis]|nr:hypothetical protein J6590_081688 [Homalodisca vitripennis]